MEKSDILACKDKLYNSLGDNLQNYLRVMRKWFSMEMSKSQLEQELGRLLDSEQFHLHQKLCPSIMEKAMASDQGPFRVQPHFMPLDSFFYSVIERHQVLDTPPPPLMKQTRTVITRGIARHRFSYGAKELQLEYIHEPVAELLFIATKHFLKNLITGMVCSRKNFKVKPNGFVHNIGSSVTNPWKKHVFNRRKSNFHPLEIDERYEALLVPSPRPSRNELVREMVFDEAASASEFDHFQPLTLSDLIITLKMNPNLIPSNYVKTINMERIYAKISHPTWDD